MKIFLSVMQLSISENLNFRNENLNFKNENLNFRNENLNFKNENLNFRNENLNFRNKNLNFRNENLILRNENQHLSNAHRCSRDLRPNWAWISQFLTIQTFQSCFTEWQEIIGILTRVLCFHDGHTATVIAKSHNLLLSDRLQSLQHRIGLMYSHIGTQENLVKGLGVYVQDVMVMVVLS
jgi:hypothetical protein